jgi:hypothetical protein
MDNRQARETGILDTEATLGVALEEEEEALESTGMTSRKTFMCVDKQIRRATNNAAQAQPLPNGKTNEYCPWTTLYSN